MKISENTYQIEELTKENARLKQEIEELQARHIYIEGKLREELDRQQNILEQKLSIESLGNENDICRRIVEVANEGMWVYDTLGKTIFVNKRITELLGFSQEEIIGKTAFEFMDAESKALAEIKIEQRLKGVKEQYEQKFIRKDGSILWATVVSSALFGENGNIEAILTMLTDITEQKLMDIALQESENRFRSLVTASSEVLYRMNADWSEMLQLKGQGFLANTESANPDWLQEYIHPDDQEYVTAVIKKAIECKNIFELEHRVKRENGKWGWTLSRAVPILDSNGEIIEWFGAAIDFTERKEAEDRIQELLRLSEQRSAELNAVIEAMPDAVYIGNLEGITLCNNSALRMLGASSLKDLQERIGELGRNLMFAGLILVGSYAKMSFSLRVL